jgi:hypothetical protein
VCSREESYAVSAPTSGVWEQQVEVRQMDGAASWSSRPMQYDSGYFNHEVLGLEPIDNLFGPSLFSGMDPLNF